MDTAENRNSIFHTFGFFDEDRKLLIRGMICTYFLGLFAHGFALFNLSISHDAVFDFYDSIEAHQHQIGLGRVLEPLYREVTGSGLLMPWSVGVAAFFWTGLAVVLVCKMFGLSSWTEVLLTAGIMTVNISVTAVAASYMPWLAVDMFALFLAVMGAYCWRLYASSHSLQYLLTGALAVTCSLALYQCYFAVSVVLMILLSVQSIIENKGAPKVFWDGVSGVGMLTAGGGIYYLLMKIVCGLAGTPLAEGYYDSVTNLWDNQENVWSRMVSCIKEEAAHFLAKDENIYPYPVVWIVNMLLFGVCAYLAVRLVRQRKTRFERGGVKTEWLLLTLLAAVLPFAAYMMRLLNTSVHDLMVYAVWLLYLLPLLLWKWTSKERAADRTVHAFIVILLSFIVFSYIQTDNAVYVKKEVESKATLSLMTEILAEVERTEGYVPGETAVLFVGQVSDILQEMPGSQRLMGISGCNKSTAITYAGTYPAYFENVMLRDVKVVFDAGTGADEEVIKMPSYPQPGYVKMLDGTVVVKLR